MSTIGIEIAGVDFTPHPGFAAPNYFSGTNARAFYRAQVTSPHLHISKFEIYLNNFATLTLNTPYTPGMPGGGEEPGTLGGVMFEQEGAVMFDSFYYSYPNDSVVVKCRVYAESVPGVSGSWFEHEYSAPAKNRAALFGINDLEVTQPPLNLTGAAGMFAASHSLAAIAYPKSLTYNWGWNHSIFFDRTGEDVNVVFYAGHGTPDAIYDGQQATQNEFGCSIGIPIYAYYNIPNPSIEADRTWHIGTGLPPYNSTGKPQFNLALHMTCNSFGSPNLPSGESYFSRYFYPYWNAYGGFCENQGFLGWSLTLDVRDYYALSTLLVDELAQGEKLAVAMQVMIAGAPNSHHNYAIGDALIDQDGNTTLRRVYDPNSSLKRWWRPIDMP
ncbi:MAG TPA: hypothetical protein PLX06_03360 [Fimbriimonadaceae bacterium]|nr:hypothetical protein [Fimbriimonadaceae bacterium]